MPDTGANTDALTPKKVEILTVSAQLFAMSGYAAVSMRDLAGATKMTPAALYHHYADKEALYYAVLRYVFTDKAKAVSDLTKGAGSVEAKFRELIIWLIKMFSSDVVFTRLLHRELLDGNRARIKLLTQEIIEPTFCEVEKLIKKLAPNRNAKSLAVSAFSMILGHFQLAPILQSMSGYPSMAEGIDTDGILALADNVRGVVLGANDATSSASIVT